MRRVIARAAEIGIPVPAFSSCLAYYDGYRRARGPAPPAGEGASSRGHALAPAVPAASGVAGAAGGES